MGYCTRYELSWTSKGDMVDEMANAIAEYIRNHEMEHAITGHSWREDIKTMSQSFPGVIFRLDGFGERNGDIWTAYFKDGKSQVHKAVIRVPPMDPEAWS